MGNKNISSRFRRLRQNQPLRDMVCETQLYPKDFIYPLFVIEGDDIIESVESMPGVYRYSVDNLDGILSEAFPAFLFLVCRLIRIPGEQRRTIKME